MAKALNSMPINIVQELFMNGHSRDEVVTYLGLITSHYATQSGIFPIELSAVRTCTCGLSVDDTKRVLRSLEEADLLCYDAGVMFLPLAATTRNWSSFQFREKHMVAVYDAYGDPGTNRAFKKWAERNPPTEKVELGRKASLANKAVRGYQPARAAAGVNPGEEGEFRAPKIGQSSPSKDMSSPSKDMSSPPKDASSPHKDASSPHSLTPSDGIGRVSEGIQGVLDTTDNPINTHRSPSDTPIYRDRDRDREDRSRVYTGGVWGGDDPPGALPSAVGAPP